METVFESLAITFAIMFLTAVLAFAVGLIVLVIK